MFCRFCGRPIQEDSEFCPYCGKSQNSTPQAAYPIKLPKFDRINISTLETVTSICFYVGVIGFLILFIKMAPGVGDERFLSYIIGAAITIAVAIVVDNIRKKEFTHQRQLVALVFGLLLLIPALTLRIVYECKVDAAVADIPESGTVCVSVEVDDEFYTNYINGMVVREPYSYITIADDRTESTSTLQIELNKAYSTQIGAGHEGEQGKKSSASSGKTNKTITFTQSNLQNGLTIKEQVSFRGGYADVTVEFERVCTFWEVIFYKPS